MRNLPIVLQDILKSDEFSAIGSLLSIAGFILSLVVLWNVRKLRNAYRLRARGPSLIRELSRTASNLNKFLNEFADSLPQVKEEMARVSVRLRSIRRNVSREQRRSINNALRYIDQCEITVQNEESVRTVYIEIIKVIEELKDYQKDLDWEV
jgi:hypothetical protein